MCRPHVAHVLGVLGVVIATFDPALLHAHAYEPLLHHFVGVDHDALWVGDFASEQYARLALADTVLYAVAGVDHQFPFVFELLEQVCGAFLAAHVDYHRFFCRSGGKLLLAVDVDLASAFAQLLGHGIHYRGVVAYMIGGKRPRAHYGCNLRRGHGL